MLTMNRMISKIVLMSLAIAFLFIAGCATIYNPATGREEVVLIDEESEIAIGAGTAKRLEQKYPLYEGAEAVAYVKRLGKEIAQVGDRPNLKYHFKVLDTEQVNAFALPGGFIYILKKA